MAKSDIKGHNRRKGEAPSPLDQALLDEFLSTIAHIAMRLTKEDSCDKNGNGSNKREVSKP
jgi:hypothetical protein